MKYDLFKYFQQLQSVFSGFSADPAVDHTLFQKTQESMFYRCVPNCFCFLLGLRSAGRGAETQEKSSI